jgi:NADP-dependent 3-hydroxy acid dehydrogenase YdfG
VGAAVALAEAAANVHLIGRGLERLQLVASKARSMGVQAICHSGNLSKNCSQPELTRLLTRGLSHVDVLIQNARRMRSQQPLTACTVRSTGMEFEC